MRTLCVLSMFVLLLASCAKSHGPAMSAGLDGDDDNSGDDGSGNVAGASGSDDGSGSAGTAGLGGGMAGGSAGNGGWDGGPAGSSGGFGGAAAGSSGGFGGAAGSGSAGAGGSSASVQEIVVECITTVPDEVPRSCSFCTCTQSYECIDATHACGAQCWDLILCAAPCDGDEGCITEKCSDFFGALPEAQATADCLNMCPNRCLRQLIMP